MLNEEKSASGGEEHKDLPLPQSDLPLPEKEIVAETDLASQGQALQNLQNQSTEIRGSTPKSSLLKNKWVLVGVFLFTLIVVGTGAYVLGKNQERKQSSQTPTITQAPSLSPTSTPDPTANWKTYSGSIYSFKYPSDGNLIETQLEENPNAIFLGKNIQINLSPINGHPTVYIRTARKTVFDENQKTESITLNGLPALQAKYIDSFKNYQDIIEFKKDNLFYNLDLEMDSSINTSGAVKVFNQILSTFKFTDSSIDTSNWKTYSIPGQYEFKYPIKDYSISSENNISYLWPGGIRAKPNDSYISKNPSDDSSFYIFAKENKDNLTLNDTAKLLGYGNNKMSSDVTVKKVNVGGLNAIRQNDVPNQGYPESDIYIITKGNSTYKNGLIYTIVLSGQNDLKSNSNAEKILSSLKFTK